MPRIPHYRWLRSGTTSERRSATQISQSPQNSAGFVRGNSHAQGASDVFRTKNVKTSVGFVRGNSRPRGLMTFPDRRHQNACWLRLAPAPGLVVEVARLARSAIGEHDGNIGESQGARCQTRRVRESGPDGIPPTSGHEPASFGVTTCVRIGFVRGNEFRPQLASFGDGRTKQVDDHGGLIRDPDGGLSKNVRRWVR